jgi:hypothetical protein
VKPWRKHHVFLHSLAARRGVEWHRLDAGGGTTRAAADPPGWPTIAPTMRPGSVGLVVHATEGRMGVTVFGLPSPRATGRPLRETWVLLTENGALSRWQRGLVGAVLFGEAPTELGECVHDEDGRVVIDRKRLVAVLDGLPPPGAPSAYIAPLAEGVSLDTPKARWSLYRALCEERAAGDGVIAAVSPAASAERLAGARWALTELLDVERPVEPDERRAHDLPPVLLAAGAFVLKLFERLTRKPAP